MTTPLESILKDDIARSGPMTVARFMAECLLHPAHGYYTTQAPFGTDGDFITAPEISQMFGEMVGLALAQAWLDRGAPSPFILAELGPGRGTLMSDILRATARVPGFHQAAQIALVEASPRLRDTQARTLRSVSPTWHDTIADLPNGPLFLAANEFFDALPIRQFVRAQRHWQERQVGLVEGALAFGLAPEAPMADLEPRLGDTKPGDLVEHCPAVAPTMGQIAGRIAQFGGAALVIDYGGWQSLGDTLQAVHRHTKVDPLTHVGQADLTAHVDFEALARACTGCSASPMVPQGVFLERLGITSRAQSLAKGLTGAALDDIIASHRRLTHPDEMGTLFQTLGVTAPGTPAIPGLDPWP